MNFHLSSNEEFTCSTIYIVGCNKNWNKISTFIKNGTPVIEIIASKNDKKNQMSDGTKNLDSWRIVVDNTITNDKFIVSVDNNILTFTGTKKSFDNLQELASDFGKNFWQKGDHVHLSYIDLEGYEYNWFVNNNIELILSVLPYSSSVEM